MVNTTRYTARQFVERVQAYSSSADLYEIKEENLLTYEQLQEIFEDKSPQSPMVVAGSRLPKQS